MYILANALSSRVYRRAENSFSLWTCINVHVDQRDQLIESLTDAKDLTATKEMCPTTFSCNISVVPKVPRARRFPTIHGTEGHLPTLQASSRFVSSMLRLSAGRSSHGLRSRYVEALGLGY